MQSNYSICLDRSNPYVEQHNSIDTKSVCVEKINAIINEKRKEIAIALKVCAHCTLCAESCFLYRSKEQIPEHMPSHKFITTLGVIYRKKGRVTMKELLRMRETLWKRCALCTRCSCPLGINIPELLALGRRILRSQGVYHLYSDPDNLNSEPDNAASVPHEN